MKKLRSGDPSNEPEPFDPVSGTWQRRLAIEERLRRKLNLSTPSDQLRRAALEVLGWAIEAADEDRSDAWYVRETGMGSAFVAGRLLACEIRRSRLLVSVIGPVEDDALDKLGAEVVDDFKWIPGG